jgi:hypothetical protein
MKYFKKEMWAAPNFGTDEEAEQADVEWKVNLAEYETLFSTSRSQPNPPGTTGKSRSP